MRVFNEVPLYDVREFRPRKNKYCICVFVINEAAHLETQLRKMVPICEGRVDIVVADGGSTDGSTDETLLRNCGVNTLLVKRSVGKLGSQMRMAFDWLLKRGYAGTVVVDGNGKDGMEAIPRFIEELESGTDHVQGSRFIPGGYHAHTPLSRLLGVKLLHAPLLSMASHFRYTDTTNGFRAYSSRLLASDELELFRDCFSGYELHYYIAIEAARKGFVCKEIPVSRVYPNDGSVPTKISSFRGNLNVLVKLWKTITRQYTIERNVTESARRYLSCVKWMSLGALGASLVMAFAITQHIRTDELFGGDLKHRHDEIELAHRGINSFHVWNGDVEVDGYVGVYRPDRPSDGRGGKTVHAYPPWHTALCWVYGSVSYRCLSSSFAVASTLSLVLCFFYLRKREPEFDIGRGFYWSALAAICVAPIFYCMCVQNYGVLMIALFIAFIWAMEKRLEFVAGLIWAMMMIKPQIATLMFFPLLFRKQYLTIFVAVSCCILGTLFSAFIFNESPVALILQIPQLGAPYMEGGLVGKSFGVGVEHMIGLTVTSVCTVICAWTCFRLRHVRQWNVAILPVLAFYPLWTYSQPHDASATVIGWSLLIAWLVNGLSTPICRPANTFFNRLLMMVMGIGILCGLVTTVAMLQPYKVIPISKLMRVSDIYFGACKLLLAFFAVYLARYRNNAYESR